MSNEFILKKDGFRPGTVFNHLDDDTSSPPPATPGLDSQLDYSPGSATDIPIPVDMPQPVVDTGDGPKWNEVT